MFAALLSAVLISAAAPAADDSLPASAWSSRMIMSFTQDGQLNGCRLENGGALRQPAAADADCLALAGVRSRPARFAPEATTNLIFEERFIPALVSASAVETPLGDELLSQQIVHVQIAPDGSVRQCRALEATGSVPPMNDDPCELVKAGFDVPRGTGEALVGTMILSVYLRAEVIA